MQFFRIRFIRLHPLIILAATISLAMFLAPRVLGPVTENILTTYNAVIVLSTLTTLPTIITTPMWPLNLPAWSLFFEYLVNIVWARGIVHMATRHLTWLVLLAAGLLLGRILYIDGAFGFEITLLDGALRVSYGFLAGVLLHRICEAGCPAWLSRIPAWALLVLLLACLALPKDAGRTVDIVALFAIFPMLIASGAYVTVSQRAARLCEISGEMSYPLYITHFPIILAILLIFHKFEMGNTTAAYYLLTMCSVIIFAAAANYLFDQPLQRFIRRRHPNGRAPTASF